MPANLWIVIRPRIVQRIVQDLLGRTRPSPPTTAPRQPSIGTYTSASPWDQSKTHTPARIKLSCESPSSAGVYRVRQAWVTYQPLCCPPTPADGRSYLTFLYPEYFCAAHWTDTLGSRSAILEHNPSRAAHFPLLPTLHAVSCCHRALLVFLLVLYCYYKTKALSIPPGFFQRGLEDSDGLRASRQAVDFLPVGDGHYSSRQKEVVAAMRS